MSGQSPASVLYSSDGYELAVQNGNAIVSGTRALLISGRNPSGNSNYVPTSSQGALGIANMSNDFIVQSAATVTTSGAQSITLNYFGTQEIALVVNVGTVTGSGSIQYTIQELDPGDGITVYGNSATTSVVTTGNAPGVFTAVLNVTTSPSVRITWTVIGTFSATIYATVTSKTSPSTQTINGTITATNPSVSTTGTAVPASATFVGGLVTTAAESGLTSGDLYALNLTTTGQLRIDGVYPSTTAIATAVDMGQVGGSVTTAAPTYTTATVNALSLDTSGNLRVLANQPTAANLNATVVGTTAAGSGASTGLVTIQGNAGGTPVPVSISGTIATNSDGYATTAAPTYVNNTYNPLSLTLAGQLRIDAAYPTATATGSAPDMSNVGGQVTTAAPTYTTATINALSLNTAGGLRIDGVSATATTTGGTAMLSGGAVTTAAPTYTTGQMDPLSLTTAGLLRIDGVYPINATTPTTDVTFVGGAVTTAAPTYTTGQLSALSLDTSGNLRVTALTNKSTTSNVTTVAGSTSNTAILAANGSRIFASIYNGTNKNMYILLNSGAASTTNYSIILITGSYWELPVDWTGAVNAVWANGVSGNALVTELTP
jgi:hypothetical protein